MFSNFYKRFKRGCSIIYNTIMFHYSHLIFIWIVKFMILFFKCMHLKLNLNMFKKKFKKRCQIHSNSLLPLVDELNSLSTIITKNKWFFLPILTFYLIQLHTFLSISFSTFFYRHCIIFNWFTIVFNRFRIIILNHFIFSTSVFSICSSFFWIILWNM